MSAVLQPDQDEEAVRLHFKKLREEAALALSKKHVPNNPNVLYGDLLSPTELQTMSILTSPVLKDLVPQVYGPDALTRYRDMAKRVMTQRVKPYNRAPIEYVMEDRHPDYISALKNYEEIGQYRDYPGNVPPAAPIEPWGLENRKKLASLGFEPETQFTTGDFGQDAKLRTLAAFAPRNLTQKDLSGLLKQFDIEGDVRFVSPSRPELGLMIKREGAEDYEIYDLPFFTASDTYEFLVQEFPALATDIALTVYGMKKYEPLMTGVGVGVLDRSKQMLKLSGLSGVGAAGGDFLRLLAGLEMGAHDRSFDEILVESGMMGALAMGGTFLVGSATKLLPSIYRKITGEDVPQDFFKKMDELMRRAEATERGESLFPSIKYGDEITIKDIQDGIQSLAEKTSEEFSQYNPTLSSATGLPSAADFELIFLKMADDPSLAAVYQQIKQGNQEVIDQFIKALNDEVGPQFGLPATGATVSEGVKAVVERDIQTLQNEAATAVNQLRRNLTEAEDVAVAGQALLREVPDERISTPLFERTRTRLGEIKGEYIEPFNKAFADSLNNPRYAEAPPTGAGFTRKAADTWANATKRQANQLFRSAEASDARGLLNELLGTEGGIVLNKLRSRETVRKPVTTPSGATKEVITPGRFQAPEFTLQELNNARMALNDFASNTSNQTAARYARELERGIEKQMWRYLEGGAAKESGFKIGSKDLARYMDETGYGKDISDAWSAQTKAIKLANAEAMRSIAQRQPEQIVDYILGTSTQGSKVNTKMAGVIEVLKKDGADEIFEMQRGLTQHVRQNILERNDLSPLQKAGAYKEFLNDHGGTLRAIFGDDFKSFPTLKTFQQNIIAPLQQLEDAVTILQARFGSIANPKPTAGNIVEELLATGRTARESGQVYADQQYLLKIIEGNKQLENQIAQVTKKWLWQQMYEPVPGGQGLQISPTKLNRLLHEGFGPEEVVGPQLTFESFIAPLLGKEGKEYVKYLKIFNNLVQREVGPASTEAAYRRVIKEAAEPKTEYLRRYLIPPLTQFGRRMTALEQQLGMRSRKFIGEMLLDRELFRKTMQAYEGQITMDAFIRFLTSYGIVEAEYLGNELQYYDPVRKRQFSRPSVKEEIKEKTQPITELITAGVQQ